MKPSIAHVGVLTAALLALCGCVATPYRTPEVAVLTRYAAGDPAPHPRDAWMEPGAHYAPSDVASDPWWHGFGDARLNRLVDDVLVRNHDLASATLKLERAWHSVGLARNDRLPVAGASASVAANKALDGGRTTRSSSAAEISIGYELDLWGRLRASESAARWQAEATAEDRESTALLLVATTCNFYWTLGNLNHSIALGEASLDSVRRTLRLVEAQYRAGAVSRLELREAEQTLQRQLVNQSQLLQRRVETRSAIAQLRDGKPWPTDQEPADLQAAALPVEPGLPAQLLGRRPDLRAAELRLRQSLAEVDATRASYYPSISLTASASGTGNGASNVLDNPLGTLLGSLRLPFLDVNGMRLNIAISRTDYDIAVSDFKQTLVEALGEVDQALSARTQLATQIEAAEASLAAAVEIERLYEVRYHAGAAPLRLWLDAQEARRAAQLSLANTRLDQLQNDVTLAKALGGSARAPSDAVRTASDARSLQE